jgi:hypothetical protein
LQPRPKRFQNTRSRTGFATPSETFSELKRYNISQNKERLQTCSGKNMTRGEIFSVMVAGMSTIAGNDRWDDGYVAG